MPWRGEWNGRIGRFGLALLAALAPALFGGYSAAAAAVLALAALSLLFFTLLSSRRPSEFTLAARLFAALSLAGLLLALFQLLPMPASVLRLISQEAMAVREANYARLGLASPISGAVSLAPYETHLFILRALGPMAAFFASLSLIRRPSDRLFVARALTLIGGAFALIGLTHRGFGAERLFGLYTPVHAHPELLTPLLNSNHLAGLFILTAPLALALAMRRDAAESWALGAFFLMVLAIPLTGSRGGIAAFFTALALFALIRRRPKAGSTLPITRPFFFALFGASALLGLWIGAGALLRELRGGEQVDAKLVLFERGLTLALDAPPLGYGRGAFGVMMSDRYPYDEEVRFAENLLLQRAVDLGLPLTALFGLAFTALFLRAIRGRRSTMSAALIAGLVGLTLQNFVDYSLELPGLGIPAAIALGALLIPRGRIRERTDRFSKAALIGLAACLVIVGASSATFVFTRAPERALERIALERSLPSLDEQRRLLDAHPRSAGVALGLAHFYRVHAPERAGVHLNRALELAPYWSRTHLELARWLLGQERAGQAAIHLRDAASIDHRSIRHLVCEFTARGALEEAVAAAPASAYESRYLDALLRCVPPESETSRTLEGLIFGRVPEHLEANLRAAQRMCREPAARESGISRLRELSREYARDPRPALALLSCLKVSGEVDAAEKEAKAIVVRMPYTRERVREILSR